MPSGLQIREDVPLAPFTTLGIGGPARYFAVARAEDDVAAVVAWAKERGVKLFVLGGGSNLLIRDAGFDGLVVQIAIRGIESCGEGCLSAGAGESWDGFVDYAIGLGLAGVECLAGVPGSVGGTPVQNVGAYGQEVAETIESVRAFDRDAMKWVELGNAECRFRYRESLFNTDEPGRYIVTRVRFRLRVGGEPTLRYADLQRRFEASKQTRVRESGPGAPDSVAGPSLAKVAQVVREIRLSKGMLIVEGDADRRSAGSFFKNPVVGVEMLGRVAAAAGVEKSEVPHWAAGEGRVKLPAAWLLEQAGFVKGYGEGAVGISTRHTLALTNRGGATCADIERLQGKIMGAVRERFGIRLEREPVVVG